MNPEVATDLVKQLMIHAVTLAAPILLTAMIVGLIISLFQSVTSIQEQTLSFVPKALAVVGILILLMPWLLRSLMEYAAGMINMMPQMTS